MPGATPRPTTAPTPAPTGAPTPAPTPAPVLHPVFTDTLVEDNRLFTGDNGEALAAIAQRLVAADAPLASALQVRPGVEIRSSGSLTLLGDWNLLRFDEEGQTIARPGASPMNLTLRAAGDLNLTHSLSDGLRNSIATVSSLPDATAAQLAAAIRPGSYIVAGAGASLRLIGGADLSAARLLDTRSDGLGDVNIGRFDGSTAADVLVRTTTGSIDIAAARDLQLLNRQAVVYTTGLPQATSSVAGLQAPPANQLLQGGSGRQSAFLDGGGDISLWAGRDLVGGANGASQYATDWWWRSTNNNTGTLSWWSRYDQFSQGFATFGGGDLVASAGQDARNLALSTAGSGSLLTASATAADGTPRSTVTFGGGDLQLQVGRDLADAFVFAGGATAQLSAGRSVVASEGQNGLQLLHLDTQIRVDARNDLALGRVVSAGLVAPLARQGSLTTNGVLLGGLSPNASLDALSSAGTLTYSGQQPIALSGNYAQRSEAESVIPATTRLAAPQGSVLVNGNLVQAPVLGADLLLLAGQDLQVSGITVTGSQPAMATPFAANASDLQELLTAFPKNNTATETGSRAPVRLVAEAGDLTFDAVQVLNPVRLIAGGDISGRTLSVQHQQADELTLLQAGRDVRLNANTADASFSVKVQGPGDLVILAGRDVDLGTSGGVGSVGNLENSALPAGGAEIAIVAGVTLGNGDLAQAGARYFHLLGGDGLASQPEHLYAQLQALADGQAAPAFGSAAEAAAAAAFAALPADEQLARTTTLLGAARTAALAAAFLAERDLATVGPDAALVQLAAQGDAVQARFIGHALADDWLARVASTDRPAQVLALAALSAAPAASTTATADPRSRYVAQLVAFVKARGLSPASDAEAVAAFDTLPAEVRLLLQQRVLFDELRVSGRAAAASGGEEREAAYERGFSALATLFPGSRASGAIRMTSSQIKTQQGGALRLLAPGGSVNAGETFTGAATKPASAIGIVTVAGGNVEVAVRDSVVVNQSRIFTVGQGDVLIWASRGDIDAGRGAKTVTGAPPPLFKIDGNGNVVVDTSGSFAGSGIAVLDSGSTLDLFAPAGEINAGDAGIQSAGNANLAAQRLTGADAIAIKGDTTSNLPPPTVNAAASLAPVTPSATTAASTTPEPADDDRKKRRRRNVLLDFLGFGQGD